MKEFDPKDLIQTGGCCGKAVDVTDTHVIVQGIYHYYDTRMESNPNLEIWDEWQCRYKIDDFAKCQYDDRFHWWDAEHVPVEFDYNIPHYKE